MYKIKYIIILLQIANSHFFVFGQYSGGIGDGHASITTINYLPLPVELYYFTSACSEEKTEIEWITTSETNNDYFTVEKSPDALIWIYLTSVDGAGNSNSIRYYSVYDNEPYGQITYYRMKQTDYDGTYTYSEIIAADCEIEITGLSNIYPDPANGYIEYVYNSSSENSIVVSVSDMTGQILYTQLLSVNTGGNKSIINLMEFKSGCYYLTIETLSGKLYKNKFIKI